MPPSAARYLFLSFLVSFFLDVLVLEVVAQESTTCENSYEALKNSGGDSPCTIAVELRVPCESDFYITSPASTLCSCNTVVYSLAYACSLCPAWNTSYAHNTSFNAPHSSLHNVTAWMRNCPSVGNNTYPWDSVGLMQDSVDIPGWAKLQVDTRFDMGVALNTAKGLTPSKWTAVQIAVPISVSLTLLIAFTGFYLYRHYRKHHYLPYPFAHAYLLMSSFFSSFGGRCARRVKHGPTNEEWVIDEGGAEDDREASTPMIHARSGSAMSGGSVGGATVLSKGTSKSRLSVSDRARNRREAVTWGLDKWVFGPVRATFGGRRVMPVRPRNPTESDEFFDEAFDDDFGIGTESGSRSRGGSGNGSRGGSSGVTGAGTGAPGSGTMGGSWRSWLTPSTGVSTGRSRGTSSSERDRDRDRDRNRQGAIPMNDRGSNGGRSRGEGRSRGDNRSAVIARTPSDDVDTVGHVHRPQGGGSGGYTGVPRIEEHEAEDHNHPNGNAIYNDPWNPRPVEAFPNNADHGGGNNQDRGEGPSNTPAPSILLISKIPGKDFSLHSRSNSVSGSGLSPSASLSVSSPHGGSSGRTGQASRGSGTQTASNSGHSGPSPAEASGSGGGWGASGLPEGLQERTGRRQGTVNSIGTEATAGTAFNIHPPSSFPYPPKKILKTRQSPSRAHAAASGSGFGPLASPPPILGDPDGHVPGSSNTGQPLQGERLVRGAGGGTVGTVHTIRTDATARSGTLSPSASVSLTPGQSLLFGHTSVGQKGSGSSPGKIRPGTVGTIETMDTEKTFTTRATDGSAHPSSQGHGTAAQDATSSFFPSAPLPRGLNTSVVAPRILAAKEDLITSPVEEATDVNRIGEQAFQVESPVEIGEWTKPLEDRRSVEVVPPTPAAMRQDPYDLYSPLQSLASRPPLPPPPPPLLPSYSTSSNSSQGSQPASYVPAPPIQNYPYQSRHPALSTIVSEPSSSSLALVPSPALHTQSLQSQSSNPDLRHSPSTVPRSLGHKVSMDSTSSMMKKPRTHRPPPFASFSTLTSSPEPMLHGQESSSSLIGAENTAEQGYLSGPSPDYNTSTFGHGRNGTASPALATGFLRTTETSPGNGYDPSIHTATQSAFSHPHPSASLPERSPPYSSMYTNSHIRSHSDQPYEPSGTRHNLSPSYDSSFSPSLSLASPYSPPLQLEPQPRSLPPDTLSNVRTVSNPHLRQLPQPPQQQPPTQWRLQPPSHPPPSVPPPPPPPSSVPPSLPSSPPPVHQHERLGSSSPSPTHREINPDSPSMLLPPSVRSAGYNPFQVSMQQQALHGEPLPTQGYASNGSVARYGGYGEEIDALAVFDYPDDRQ